MEKVNKPAKTLEAHNSVTYSITTKDGFNALVTSRADSINELFSDMLHLEEVFATRGDRPQERYAKASPSSSHTVTDPNAPVCPFHNKPMTKRTGQYGDFYTCSTIMPDGRWCPYKPDKK